MKKQIVLLSFFSMLLVACGGNNEIENLKKENAALVEQVNALKAGTYAKSPKYFLKLHLEQSHFSLSIKKHIKDAVNSIDFELPVDKDFYDSVSKGTKVLDKFRFGSFVLYGSYGDWEMTVSDKYVK